jgi:catechol 2,3-dioxygenase-like lactoylglutathione lyase family enzyme
LGELAIKQFADTWEQTNQETDELLATAEASIRRGAMSNAEATLETLGCTDPKINGAGTVSAVGALYLASRYAARPMDGLLAAAFLRKGDTDTLASMTGALLGAVHGKDWLEGLAHTVQDSDYITAIATALVEYPEEGGQSSPVAGREVLQKRRERWRRDVQDIQVGGRGFFPDGRNCYVTSIDVRPDADIKRIRLRLDDGQTVLQDVRETRSTPQALPDRDIDIVAKLPDAAYQTKDLAAHSAGTGAVTALTNNLHRAVAFYARILGREIPVRGDEAAITDWFRLRQAARELRPGEASTAAVTLYVSTPSTVTTEHVIVGFDRKTHATIVRDPDGRNVIIRTASTGQQSRTNPRSRDENAVAPRESEIPPHVFGDLADEFYAAVGRTGTLSSMLEDRIRALLQAMEHEPQTSYASQGATALVTMVRKCAPSTGDAWKDFDEFAARADTVLRLRNDLLHNLWQPKPGGYFFGHRTDQRTGERRSTTISINDVRYEVAELVALNEEWRHWYMLASSLPFSDDRSARD